MNMHWIDWSILAGLAMVVSIVALSTQKYTKSVADFLVANRCAGKYLLGVADGIAALGAIAVVARFEMFYKAGFTAIWWETMALPMWVFLGMFGWVQYRYRQTRVLTMAQFLEIRYSRRFRVFAGFLAFTSGIVNFGIFPAVGGRFFQHYCGLPQHMISIGFTEIDLTYALIMLVMIIFSLALALCGGQITVIVTDFLQGTFVNIVFVTIAIYLLFVYFDWSQIVEAAAKAPAEASLINPLKTSKMDNFNMWYFMIGMFGGFINFMAWQGQQGYFASAKSPHEARMGRVVGMYRWFIQTLPIILLALAAFAVLHHQNFSTIADSVNNTLSKIDNPKLKDQLIVTVVATKILPTGLLGAFAAVMFAAFVSTHDTYLHSWGSIFVQDVILPIRQTIQSDSKPLSAKLHIRYLRLSMVGVAIFIFLFSLFFNQKQDIFMFFALTGTLYLGWAGWTIVGGLYWKYGNAAGAWMASFVGIILSFLSWSLIYSWPACQSLLAWVLPSLWKWMTAVRPELTGEKFPISAQILYFWSMVAAGSTYAIVSLITGRCKAFNMDRMLHRGEYAVKDDKTSSKSASRGLEIFRMGKNFAIDDKILFVFSYIYVFVFFGIFVAGMVWTKVLGHDVSDSAWAQLWQGFCILSLVLAIIFTIWFLLGGLRDFKRMFDRLRLLKHDRLDDGTVVDHQSLTDVQKENNEIKGSQ